MMKLKLNLLTKVILAVILGIGSAYILPDFLARVFITFNVLFSDFLGFIIPLIILGLIVPGIFEIGSSAKKLLVVTIVLAYTFTLFSGFMSYGAISFFLPWLSGTTQLLTEQSSNVLEPYFKIALNPVFGVMTALVLAFVLGIGITGIKGDGLRGVFIEFKQIIVGIIEKVIIPLLPLFIFGIFMNMTISGQISGMMSVFFRLILVIFVLTVVLLVLQFTVAGLVTKKNPLVLLKRMLGAYFTALGTQSSAATIPVTLSQTIKNGVDPSVAAFVVPICATIHLSGSTMKIVACALVIASQMGIVIDFPMMGGFIAMLAIVMIAAPGVPGGAIMASLGVLESMLGFNEQAIGLMIALYIAMDSFGTATNVTGDGAIALLVDRFQKRQKNNS